MSRELDRLVVAAELRDFDDGEATFGQLLWTLQRGGLLGCGDELRRRAWSALRGLDASGVVLLIEPDHDDGQGECSVLLLAWPTDRGGNQPHAA